MLRRRKCFQSYKHVQPGLQRGASSQTGAPFLPWSPGSLSSPPSFTETSPGSEARPTPGPPRLHLRAESALHSGVPGRTGPEGMNECK